MGLVPCGARPPEVSLARCAPRGAIARLAFTLPRGDSAIYAPCRLAVPGGLVALGFQPRIGTPAVADARPEGRACDGCADESTEGQSAMEARVLEQVAGPSRDARPSPAHHDVARSGTSTARIATSAIPSQATTVAETTWNSPTRSGSKARRAPTASPAHAPNTAATASSGSRAPARPRMNTYAATLKRPTMTARTSAGPITTSSCHARRCDAAAAKAPLAVVEHGGLTRSGGPDGSVCFDDPAVGPGRRIATRARFAMDRGGHERATMPDPDVRAEAVAVRRIRGDESDVLELDRGRLEVLPARERDHVGARVHSRDVARLGGRDAETAPLANGEARGAAVLPHPLAIGVDDRAGLGLPAAPRSERPADVAVGDEADPLALRLLSR